MGASFKSGQIVYSRDGTKYEFAEALSGDRALCRPIMLVERYDGSEEYPSDTPAILYASQLYAKPPVNVVSAEVKAADAELAAAKQKLGDAQREFAEQQREHLARLAKFQAIKPLKLIEDYIDGKITHFAVRASYGSKVEVVTTDTFLTVTDDYNRSRNEMKLLSLFGDAKGNLEWRRNDYRDGSGHGWLKCVPCLSEDDAKAEAADMLDGVWNAFRIDQRQPWVLADSISSAEAIGLPVPDDIRAAVVESSIKAAKNGVEKARVELEKHEQALAAAISRALPGGEGK